jgi:hypothetical protein
VAVAREEGRRSSDFAIVASTLSGSKREESDTSRYEEKEEEGEEERSRARSSIQERHFQ